MGDADLPELAVARNARGLNEQVVTLVGHEQFLILIVAVAPEADRDAGTAHHHRLLRDSLTARMPVKVRQGTLLLRGAESGARRAVGPGNASAARCTRRARAGEPAHR